MNWPKKEYMFIKNRVLYISIPFTWRLPEVKKIIRQRNFFYDRVIVGGPAVYLIPDYFKRFEFVKVGYSFDGILQKVNKLATKTTTGCVRKCGFCAVPGIEGNFRELDDWPDLPIICDNNLLACSKLHFDKVIDRLKKFNEVDFNQGIDSRLLKKYHANRLAELKKPIIRLALDNMDYVDNWSKAYRLLRDAKLPKKSIRSYALIGFDSNPDECWERCEFIDSMGIKVLPMWYHELNQMIPNIVTSNQKILGWSNAKRLEIMGYYYRHRFPRERKRYYDNRPFWV